MEILNVLSYCGFLLYDKIELFYFWMVFSQILKRGPSIGEERQITRCSYVFELFAPNRSNFNFPEFVPKKSPIDNDAQRMQVSKLV